MRGELPWVTNMQLPTINFLAISAARRVYAWPVALIVRRVKGQQSTIWVQFPLHARGFDSLSTVFRPLYFVAEGPRPIVGQRLPLYDSQGGIYLTVRALATELLRLVQC